MYLLGNPPDYEQPPENTLGAQARRQGRQPEELAYDAMLTDDGRGMLYVPFLNYADGNLDATREMLRDPNAVPGLSDGGAHCGIICDASFPTYLLTHWTRDRSRGEKLSIPFVVAAQSRKTALSVGLYDRGVIAPGFKADVNVIDYDRLHLHPPKVHYDLPVGGRRLMQQVDGYDATIVSGVVTQRGGKATGARPGKLVRGAQGSKPQFGRGGELAAHLVQHMRCRPCERVRFRGIGKGLDRRLVAEAFQAGSIIVVDELAEEGVAIGVAGEGAASAAAFVLATDGFGNAPIEAFDHAVGLRMIRLGQAMLDTALLAEAIKRMVAGGPAGRLVLHVDGEAVGELGAIVGQDGMNLVREVGQEALEEGRCRLAIPPGMDLDIDVTGGAIDRDKDVALVALQVRQVLQVDVDEANTGGLEDPGFWLVRFGACADAVSLQATVMAPRDSPALTHRCITSTMSSSGNCSDVRSSQTSRSSSADKLICSVFVVCAGQPRCCSLANA